jgi:phage tail protein X
MTTILCWQEDGEDREACAKVIYTAHKGYAATLVDPSEPASIEIDSIVRTDPGDPIDFARWQYDEELLAECMEDWIDDAIAAEEYRADQRRDDEMMERFNG